MIKEKIKKAMENLFKKNKNNKKNIENLVVFLILLIITVIAINTIWGDTGTNNKEKINDKKSSHKVLAKEVKSNKIDVDEYNLQDDLKDILSKIQGVGKVDVLITYSATNSISPIYNEKQATSTTEETDTSGGKRIVESTDINKEIIFEEKNGANTPVIEKIIMPKVEGAIITAEGGGNAMIKSNIIQAVVAVTGISSYKVQVFEMAKT